MANSKFTPEQEREIAMLRAQNEMLEASKQDALKRGKKDAAKRLSIAQEETLMHISTIDPNKVEEIKIESEQKIKRGNVNSVLDTDYSIADILASNEEERSKELTSKKQEKKAEEEEAYGAIEEDTESEANVDLSNISEIDPTIQYDLIQLPSNGECYKNKTSKIPVAYLTAYDENFITSPNLYKDGLVIDFLLKNKIVGNVINPDDLISGDADAITLFLRATSYGPEFPIIANDPETGEKVETTVDLGKLKMREFKLVGDENGNFEYTLPISKKVVKFRYLTRKQEKDLQKITQLENYGTRAHLVQSGFENILTALPVDKILTDSEKNDLKKTAKIIDRWIKKLNEKSKNEYNRIITNSLQMQVVSVDGNDDNKFIRKFINEMPARDSLMLRRYISDNRPGIDFEVEVERPENLGGGSFKTFLNWDDSVFLNIPDL